MIAMRRQLALALLMLALVCAGSLGPASASARPAHAAAAPPWPLPSSAPAGAPMLLPASALALQTSQPITISLPLVIRGWPDLALLRFAVIGDYGKAGAAEADVATLVHSWSPDLVITTGDNNYDLGEQATIDANIGQYYHDFISPYTGGYGPGATTNRFFPSLGNHDWYTAGAAAYLSYFTLPGNERYYDVLRGPVHFFAIDSDPGEPDGVTAGSTQALWLQQRLASSTAVWQVVYFHHPPYSSGEHGNTTVMQWPFEAWGADLVLSGHDHDYERIMLGGFPYIVNGLGGRSLYTFGTPVAGSVVRYSGDYGAMLVEASPISLTLSLTTRGGQTIDTLTLSPP
jgi:tartrate-resistant acid phosphatase type 5